MSDIHDPIQSSAGDAGSEEGTKSSSTELIAMACGILGVAAAVWAFWLIVPGVLLGLVAIVLGSKARRDGNREGGSVAIALGIAAILLVPSVLVIVDGAESWGRDCALNPSHDPNC